MITECYENVWSHLFFTMLDVGLIVILGMLLVHLLIGFRTVTVDTYAMFECGFDGLDSANESIDCSILFFILIFLVFDLELIILIYWFAGQIPIAYSGTVILIFGVIIGTSILEAYYKLIE